MKPHPYPSPTSLRRSVAWQPRPRPAGVRRAIAVHEAGHCVLMGWIGLESPKATIEVDDAGARGAAHWPSRHFFAQLPERPPDEDGMLAATAAAVYHAGLVAEMLDAGTPWTGPVHYSAETDYLRADDMLRERFGRHASGAHAYAQQVAMHVLSGHWRQVEAIAQQLEREGHWAPLIAI